MNEMELQCPNCGERLSVSDGQFVRLAQSGTIDVNVVDVNVVDVTALPADEDV
ncbi:MAG: hypothetical protein HC795_17575 [Coleofasciculaceae cyanobacterium RL_1_1]|nr:hypothetical protein [Coleofasciculaceae cyanobacterium RL_1_1]